MEIRNVAIIAHVDHGKTTLVDALLRQSKTTLNKEESSHDLIMDSNDLEKERGITIFSKNASMQWGDVKINIIDTPGHADFGGEVERVLSMTDGCLLLIDAQEGPMPQTRFVLKQALAMNLKVVVVVNKIDKPGAQINISLNKTFDLFIELGASDEAADFPIVYASAKNGKAGHEPDLSTMTDITPVFETILKHIPAPTNDSTKPFQMMITTVANDSFKGRIATGRINRGVVKAKQDVVHINRDGAQVKKRISSLMTYVGLARAEVDEARAGDLVAIAGIADVTIGETLADPEHPDALPVLHIEEPTVKMRFMINDSPFAGREGDFCTSRQIRERLYVELETDMALKVEDAGEGGWIVCGRGELHLAILIERLRREGFELQVSQPQVIVKVIDGKELVPFEMVFIEVPDEYAGAVIQKLGSRNGIMQHMSTLSGITSLEFVIPTRGLFGYRNDFLTDTRGLGIINTMFHEYKPDPGNWKARDRGSLIAHLTGETRLHGLLAAQERGALFLNPGMQVYAGQVVGQNTRGDDMSVNVCKEKQLSNMRSKGEGVAEHFKVPHIMELEDALDYIGADELVEITPKNIRIRKTVLDENQRKRKS